MTTLEDVCAEHRLAPPPNQYPGTEYRVDDLDKPGQEDGWIYLFPDGRGGSIQNHRIDDKPQSFFFDGATRLTPDQRTQLQRVREQERQRRIEEAAQAAAWILQLWSTQTRPTGFEHPYIARKQAYWLAYVAREIRQDAGVRLLQYMQAPILMLPILDWSGRFVGAQYIGADGEKRYHPRCINEGGMLCLNPGAWNAEGAFYVAEGASTAATVAQATGRPCLCAYDAGNLPKVAASARQVLGDMPIVICADDDIGLEREGKRNKGLIKAEEAARMANAFLARPSFTGLSERGNWSDFNDVAACLGIDEARKQLQLGPQSSPVPWWIGDDPLNELGLHFGEADLATSFARLRSADTCHVNAWGKWLIYQNGVWKNDDTLVIYDDIGQLCQHLIATGRARRNDGMLRKASTRSAVERIVKSDRRIAATDKQFDQHKWLLNTPHGIVDLYNGRSEPHQPGYYLTQQTEVSPSGRAPRWEQFVSEIMCGDMELVAYLQRLAGYCLTGETGEQALIFFYGEGRNGKGTFLDTLKYVMADYYKAFDSEVLTESRNERHKSELAVLRGARLVTAQEIDQSKSWHEKKLKELTGQDTITANFMRQDPFTFVPTFKLIISSNNKPRFTNVDAAIQARMHLVPFQQNFEQLGTKDPGLREKLKMEAPGILQWMIDGCAMWRMEGLSPPDAIKDATKEYLDEEDLETQWIEERTIRDPFGSETLVDLFKDWTVYAENRHGRPKRHRDLAEKLIRKGYKKRRDKSNATSFEGIRLISRNTFIYDRR